MASHSFISDLQKATEDKVQRQDQVPFPATKTSQDIAFLLYQGKLPSDFPLFYTLFSYPLTDNDARSAFVSSLRYFVSSWLSPIQPSPTPHELLPYYQAFLTHVLEDVSWEDNAVLQRFSNIIINFSKEPNPFTDVLKKSVRGISFNYNLEFSDNFQDLFNKFPHLKIIKISNVSKELTGFELFQELEKLDLQNNKWLRSLSMSKPMPNLKTIDLSNTGVQTIEWLQMCPFLETLDLGSTPVLQSLIIKAPMEHLKNIDLSNSYVQTIAIETPLPLLENLKLSVTKQLKSLIISESMQNLKNIDLAFSGIPTIAIEAPCPFLENLNLAGTRNLQSLVIKAHMERLKNIDLSPSGIQTIAIEAPLPLLENLNLIGTRKLKSLVIKAPMEHIKNIDLSIIPSHSND